jgi:hypothetical protein
MNGIGAHTGQTYIQTLIFIYIDSRYSYFLHYCARLTFPSVRPLQGPLLHSPQLLSSQHSPSANSYPFGAGSSLVLTGPTNDRCSHPPLPRKDGSDRLQWLLLNIGNIIFMICCVRSRLWFLCITVSWIQYICGIWSHLDPYDPLSTGRATYTAETRLMSNCRLSGLTTAIARTNPTYNAETRLMSAG